MSESIVCYSLKDIPDGLVELDEMDLELKWETAVEKDQAARLRFTGLQELNELFEERIRKLLQEKEAVCVHVRREKISHTHNFAHGSSVVTGEYQFTLYGQPRNVR